MTPTTHVHSDLSTTFHVTTQQRGKQHHAVTSLGCRSLVASEQPEILMQWFAVIGLFRGTCPERRETSLGFMLEQATQGHRHLSTMFHVTTQHRGKQHTRLRTIFWFAKSCPTACCVWKALNQRVSAGGHPSHHWWMANEEANDESCKRTCNLPPSDMARWLSHKPPMPT